MTLIPAQLRQGERYAIYSRFNQTITLVARPPIRAPILLPLLLVPSNRIQLYAKSSRLVRTPRRVEHSSLFFRGGNTITKGGRGKEDRRNFCVVPIIAFFFRSLNLFIFLRGQAVDGQVCEPLFVLGGGVSDCEDLELIYRTHNSLG